LAQALHPEPFGAPALQYAQHLPFHRPFSALLPDVMPCMLVALTLLAVAVAHSTQEQEQDPDSVVLLQAGLDLVSTLGKANATRQIPIADQNYIHDGIFTTTPAPQVRSDTWYERRNRDVEWKAFFAEYVAMTLFVIVGCGTAMAIPRDMGSAWILQVAFSFGLAITTLAWGVGHYSGGQINCAVTLALWICGSIGWAQALLNVVAQLLGSITGAVFLSFLFPKEMDKTGNLACNAIGDGFHWTRVFLGEFAMTFLLVITVLECTSHANLPGLNTIPIGFAVFLAHCLLIPVDGCSINPTRSFGPALVASIQDGKADYFQNHEIFWLGPLTGAAVGAGIHSAFLG